MAEDNVTITTGGQDRVRESAALLSDAFSTDPIITYLLSALSAEERDAYRPKFFHAMMKMAALNGASFEEVDGWQSCGVTLPPGRNIDSISRMVRAGLLGVVWNVKLRGCASIMWELPSQQEPMKKKAFKQGEKYYYIFFLGTAEAGRGRGYCSSMVRHYQALAARDGVAVYLEASNAYAWGLYKSLGFVTVGEILIGKGRAAADGTLCPGGPGARLWAMVWRAGDGSSSR